MKFCTITVLSTVFDMQKNNSPNSQVNNVLSFVSENKNYYNFTLPHAF